MLRTLFLVVLGLGGGAALLRADIKAEMTADEARRARIDREIVAIAGKREITVRDFREAIVRSGILAITCGGDRRPPEVQKREGDDRLRATLHALIEDVLIEQEFARRKLPPISKRAIDQELLAEWPGRTIAEIEELARKEGVDLARTRSQIATSFAVEHMEDLELPDRIVKRLREVERYYTAHALEFHRPDQVQLQVISVDCRTESDEVLADRIVAIERALDESVAFDVIAQRHTNPGSAKKLNQPFWVSPNQLRSEFAREVLTMRDDEIRGPFHSAADTTWIRRNQFRPAGIAPLAEVREEIEQRLAEDEEKRWRAEFRAHAKVVIFDEPRAPQHSDAKKNDPLKQRRSHRR